MTTLSISDLRTMRDDASATRSAGSMSLLIAFCIFTATVGRLCYIVRPFDSDGSMFIYMGKLVDEGARFGRDLVDNKFPSVGLITSIPWRMFRNFWPGYVLLGGAISALSTILLTRIATQHLGERARLPAMLFSLVYLNFNFAVFGGFQLETIQSLFAIIAAGAALNVLADGNLKDAFTVGLAAGVAAMCKPTGLAVLGAFGMVMLLASPRKSIAAFIATAFGLALPVGVVLIYLVKTGTLRDMPALWKQIATYAANSSWDSTDWTKPLTILILGGFPFLVRGWIFRAERTNDRIESPVFKFVLLWLVLEAIGVAMQRRMYAYHFLVLAGPLTLLFAMLPCRITARSLFMAVAPIALFSLYGASLVIEITYTGRERSPVSTWLLQHATQGDRVWRDDAAKLWIETDLRPASRFPMTFLFANYDNAPLDYGKVLIDDFKSTRPAYIVLPRELDRMLAHQCKHILELNREPKRRDNFITAWKWIEQYTRANYTKVATIEQDAIYQRVR